ncbi:unnamed protein product, partial [Laminaria digitata]
MSAEGVKKNAASAASAEVEAGAVVVVVGKEEGAAAVARAAAAAVSPPTTTTTTATAATTTSVDRRLQSKSQTQQLFAVARAAVGEITQQCSQQTGVARTLEDNAQAVKDAGRSPPPLAPATAAALPGRSANPTPVDGAG